MTNNLDIVNRGDSSTTFITKISRDVLDLTIKTSKIVQVVEWWPLMKHTYMSDHRQICRTNDKYDKYVGPSTYSVQYTLNTIQISVLWLGNQGKQAGWVRKYFFRNS